MAKTFDAAQAREQFPALHLTDHGAPRVYFDNPAGTQVPQRVIDASLSMALDAAETGGRDYDGYVLLGCVIRGETSHYDIVAGESGRAIMDLAVAEGIAIGYGILTVENDEQAWVRAERSSFPPVPS